MNIYPLNALSENRSNTGIKTLSRVLEIACLDENVSLAFKTGSLDNLWEYEENRIRNLIQEANELGGTGLPFQKDSGRKLKGREDVKQLPPGEDYVVLDEVAEKTIKKNSTAFQTIFTRLIRIYLDEAPKIISPNNEGKESDGSINKKAFVFCNLDKEAGQLKFNDFEGMHVEVDDLFLMADMRKTEYRKELLKLIPELVKLPDHVQHSLQRLPDRYENIPEKLDCITEAYKKYWADLEPGGSLRESVEEIDKKAEKHMRSMFSKLQDVNQNDIEKGVLHRIKLGHSKIEFSEGAKNFSIEIIKPEFLNKDPNLLDGPISLGVPKRFWVLHCVAEFFWKDVNRKDLADHPSGKHIENVLNMLNRPNVFSKKILKAPLDKEVDGTPYSDAMNDLQKLLKWYPEISYLSDVNFASDARTVASIIRPLWAKSKEKQTGYAKKAEHDRKIYYSVTREKGDPPKEWK